MSAKIIPFPKAKKTSSEEQTFKEFGEKLRNQDLEGASLILAFLLGVSNDRALKATNHFFKKMSSEGPLAISKAMKIRECIQIGDSNSALQLLMECYGLDMIESLSALNKIAPSA